MEIQNDRLTFSEDFKTLLWDQKPLIFAGMSLSDLLNTEVALNYLEDAHALKDAGSKPDSGVHTHLELPSALNQHDLRLTLKFSNQILEERLTFEVIYKPTPEELNKMNKNPFTSYKEVNLKCVLLAKTWFEHLIHQDLMLYDDSSSSDRIKYSVYTIYNKGGYLSASIVRGAWDSESFNGEIGFPK